MIKNFLLIIILFFCSCVYSQSYNTLSIKSDEIFRSEIKKLIENECDVDSTKKLKIIFTLKIDSLGEIHSAHIRKADGLNFECHYNVNRILEDKFNVKYLFDLFKDMRFSNYLKIDFPYYE